MLLARLLDKKLLRYLIAGGTAFLTEYAVFVLLYQFASVQVYAANSISFCAGLAVSFLLNRSWAFKGGEYTLGKHAQLIRYIALAFINLALTNFIIGTLISFDLPPLAAKVGAMVAIVVWNFLIFRYYLFAEKKT